MMRAGIKYLGDLKSYAQQEIGCEDAHQLMRTMELFDLIDLAEAVAISSPQPEKKAAVCTEELTIPLPILC